MYRGSKLKDCSDCGAKECGTVLVPKTGMEPKQYNTICIQCYNKRCDTNTKKRPNRTRPVPPACHGTRCKLCINHKCHYYKGGKS